MTNKRCKEFRETIETPTTPIPDFETGNPLSDEHLSDAYLFILTHIAFKLNEKWGKNVKFHIEAREKSKESARLKKERYNDEFIAGERDDATITDYLAATIIVDSVREVTDTKELRALGSKNVREEMLKRSENIDLLGNIISFINEQLQFPNFESNLSEETTNEQLKAMHSIFNRDIAGNILKFRPDTQISDIEPINLNEAIIQIITKKIEEAKGELDTLNIKNSKDRKAYLLKNVELYESALEELIGRKTEDYEQEYEKEDEEEYYKYLIILLDRLKDVVYKTCEPKKEKITPEYTKINNDFNITLDIFCRQLTEQGFSEDVKYEQLDNLSDYCTMLNAQMSDKLEQALIREAFKDNNISLMQDNVFSARIPSERIERKVYENGYVADHAQLIIQFKANDEIQEIITELQGKTGFRKLVATYGDAAHGRKITGIKMSGKRQQRQEEKVRKYDMLPIWHTSGENPDKFQVLQMTYKTLNDFKDDKNHYTQWLTRMQEVTPKYVTLKMEEGNVVCTICSFLSNIKRYFEETNVRKKRKILDDSIWAMMKAQLVSAKDENVVFTRSGYRKYIIERRLLKKVDQYCENKNLKEATVPMH